MSLLLLLLAGHCFFHGMTKPSSGAKDEGEEEAVGICCFGQEGKWPKQSAFLTVSESIHSFPSLMFSYKTNLCLCEWERERLEERERERERERIGEREKKKKRKEVFHGNSFRVCSKSINMHCCSGGDAKKIFFFSLCGLARGRSREKIRVHLCRLNLRH